jgi:hypothetical protein
VRLGEGLSCAPSDGQTTIGLGGCGLEGVPIQGRRQGGSGIHGASGHLRKKANLVGVKQEQGMSGGNEGGLGWTFVNIAARTCETKKANGEKVFGG